MSIRRQEALDYHAQGRPGKIQVSPTKPFKNQRDLSLAYTPGVAEPCREIAARPEEAYTYTAKGNLVAVVTDGTAVLGLGNIGPLAEKPVMEGKGVLFKKFANIDVFDIELNTKTNEEFIAAVKALEPTFGGINLEDVKAPECFIIEETLKKELKGADVLLGLSVAGSVTPDMIEGMAKKPIVFAMANPDPEIMPDVAKKVRPDVIMATGRSDFPNQVNNVLGFPFIFRGALDCRATTINDEMKLAASEALAELAKEEVPDNVLRAYGSAKFTFGREYLIPKPFD